jgi:hypothetical protein
MLDRHVIAYAALLVHAILAIILFDEGATHHALCVVFAALIYAVLCVPVPNTDGG